MVLAAPPLHAQFVRGMALDAESGRPVADASITLIVERTGRAETTVRSDSLGRFAMTASEPGGYRLRVQRIGYKEATSGLLVLEEGMAVELEMRLAPAASLLQPLRVFARRSWREWGKDGFERRRALGKGVFLTPEDIARVDPRLVTDYLRDVQGLQILYHGGDSTEIRSLRGHRCLRILVKRLPMFDGGLPFPHQVAAVEVYRDFREVPEEFRYLALREGGSCGIVNFWSRRAWEPLPERARTPR
jgi:hypothetical protein